MKNKNMKKIKWQILIKTAVFFSMLFVFFLSASTSLAAGLCGDANGVAVSSFPYAYLCAIGDVTNQQTKDYEFTWTCDSDVDVSCSAPRKRKGECGSASGIYDYSTTKPTDNLCSIGTPSVVSANAENITWTWTCSGVNGGSVSGECASGKKIDGKCASPPNGATYSSCPSPTPKLCSVGWCPSGTTVFGTGPWTWTCCGYHGGLADSCQANYDCKSSTWTPDPATVCKGTEFQQKDNCGNYRSAWGTNDPAIWTPDPSTFCSGISFVQTNGCRDRDATGNKDCSTLAPTLTFSASPNPVDYNTSTILTWKTTNATSCSASGDWSGTKEINGSETSLKLTVRQTFTLECWNSANVSSGPQSVTVDVNSCVSDDFQCTKIDPVCPSTTGIAFCANTCGETNPSKCSDCAPKTITCEKTDSGIWTEVKP